MVHEHPIQVGAVAPDFELRAAITKPEVERVTIKLSDYRGKKNVVLAFHPLAFTAT
jgi:peroxiredoxin